MTDNKGRHFFHPSQQYVVTNYESSDGQLDSQQDLENSATFKEAVVGGTGIAGVKKAPAKSGFRRRLNKILSGLALIFSFKKHNRSAATRVETKPKSTVHMMTAEPTPMLSKSPMPMTVPIPNNTKAKPKLTNEKVPAFNSLRKLMPQRSRTKKRPKPNQSADGSIAIDDIGGVNEPESPGMVLPSEAIDSENFTVFWNTGSDKVGVRHFESIIHGQSFSDPAHPSMASFGGLLAQPTNNEEKKKNLRNLLVSNGSSNKNLKKQTSTKSPTSTDMKNFTLDNSSDNASSHTWAREAPSVPVKARVPSPSTVRSDTPNLRVLPPTPGEVESSNLKESYILDNLPELVIPPPPPPADTTSVTFSILKPSKPPMPMRESNVVQERNAFSLMSIPPPPPPTASMREADRSPTPPPPISPRKVLPKERLSFSEFVDDDDEVPPVPPPLPAKEVGGRNEKQAGANMWEIPTKHEVSATGDQNLEDILTSPARRLSKNAPVPSKNSKEVITRRKTENDDEHDPMMVLSSHSKRPQHAQKKKKVRKRKTEHKAHLDAVKVLASPRKRLSENGAAPTLEPLMPTSKKPSLAEARAENISPSSRKHSSENVPKSSHLAVLSSPSYSSSQMLMRNNKQNGSNMVLQQSKTGSRSSKQKKKRKKSSTRVDVEKIPEKVQENEAHINDIEGLDFLKSRAFKPKSHVPKPAPAGSKVSSGWALPFGRSSKRNRHKKEAFALDPPSVTTDLL